MKSILRLIAHYLSDSSSSTVFGTRLKYLTDIIVITIDNIIKAKGIGRLKKIIGPPMETDWRNDSSNIDPKMNPKINGAIGHPFFLII